MNFVVDVEADGPCPGLYSMVSIGVVELSTMKGFYNTLKPISDHYQEDALKACNFTRQETLKFDDSNIAMTRLNDWLNNFYGNKVFWSDNNGFDWQFVNYYFHLYDIKNPFGFSSRRIGDYYCGRVNDLSANRKWKKLRKTKHTHNALDDAMGNAESLKQIMKGNY